MSQVLDILNQPINLQGLVDALEFDEETFDKANLEQAKLFLEASRYRVNRMRRRFAAAARLEDGKAQASMHVRERQDTIKGSKRLTESAIAEKVTLDSNVRALRKKLNLALGLEEFAKQLLEAYHQRQAAIKVIAQVRSSEISNDLRVVKERLAFDDYRDKSRNVREHLDRQKS